MRRMCTLKHRNNLSFILYRNIDQDIFHALQPPVYLIYTIPHVSAALCCFSGQRRFTLCPSTRTCITCVGMEAANPPCINMARDQFQNAAGPPRLFSRASSQSASGTSLQTNSQRISKYNIILPPPAFYA